MFEIYQQSYLAFVQAGVPNPEREAWLLVDLLSQGALRRLAVPPQTAVPDLTLLAQQRQQGKPLEYILGRALFMGLELHCTPDTLIPRAETELLAQIAIEQAQQLEATAVDGRSPLIADIGTGCGNLAVTLGQHTTHARLLASDISPQAIAIARQNVQKFQLEPRTQLFCGDLCQPLLQAGYHHLDMVVCNPPYIPTTSLDKLGPEIINFEPVVALDAGPYGLNIFRRLLHEAADLLRPGGWLGFEIGVGQEKLVLRLLERQGSYAEIRPYSDPAGHVRGFTAQKS